MVKAMGFEMTAKVDKLTCYLSESEEEALNHKNENATEKNYSFEIQDEEAAGECVASKTVMEHGKKAEKLVKSRIKAVESNKKTKGKNSCRKSQETSTCHKAKTVVHVCPHEGCQKVFGRPNRLAQHLRTHTGERPYKCPSADCFRSYTRQQHLKRHIEIGHQDDSSEGQLKCEECEKLFSNAYTLKKHHVRYHVRPRYECNECEKTFKKQQHLKTHSFLHTGVKPYRCDFPECNSRFETPSRLKRHSMTHEKNRYACPQESCERTYDRYKDLQHHLSTSHPKVCDICGSKFRQLRRLRVHRQTHETVREAYFCPFAACDRYFYQENNLRTHIKMKHDEINIYECGVCSKRLSTKQKLMQHMITHGPSYKRNYTTEKPRKPRKDKGTIRRDLPRLLSGYNSDEEYQKAGGPENSESILDLQGNTPWSEDPDVREEFRYAATERTVVENECSGDIRA